MYGRTVFDEVKIYLQDLILAFNLFSRVTYVKTTCSVSASPMKKLINGFILYKIQLR